LSNGSRVPTSPSVDVSDIDGALKLCAEIDRAVAVALAHLPRETASRQCYVTFATPDYSLGLTVLIRSLRRYSQRPVVVLADRAWSFDAGQPNVFVVVVPRLANRSYAPARNELKVALTKLWIFGLLSLDRVVYVDADCLVLQPIDELFDRSGMWCPPDYVESAESTRFSSGLIAFSPSVELRDRIFRAAPTAESYDHADQGLLNSIISSDVNFLPPDYCVARHYYLFHGAEMQPGNIRILHYIAKKPWELWYRETSDTGLSELDDKWTAELTHAELLELVSQWRRRQFNFERPRLESLRPGVLVATLLGNRKIRAITLTALGVVLAVLVASAVSSIVTAVKAVLQ
jgi:hypothetical protein